MTDRENDLAVLQGSILRIRQLGIGTLVTTTPGAAPRVAAAIDADLVMTAARVTVAGDDTVLILDAESEPGDASTIAAIDALGSLIGEAAAPSPQEILAVCATAVVPVSDWVIGVRTSPGAAQVVAFALDSLGGDHVPGMVGTLAGDDLVMVLLDEGTHPFGPTAAHLNMLTIGA